ncbi:pilus assembly protein [Kineococcus gynurae]|uniref:Pilus assembly protein n=1 Tax=Kineococcus gynurae TaxID=452979 RepID=A0ABV5LX94_9ACTN
MTGSARGAGPRDAGSAAIEFLTVGVLLLVPIAYLLLCLGRVQAATFAAGTAARQAALLVASDPAALATRRARAAVVLALGDQGFPAGAGDLRLHCSATPCRTPQAEVRATVGVTVPLPLLSGLTERGTVLVRVTEVAVVDRFLAPGPA